MALRKKPFSPLEPVIGTNFISFHKEDAKNYATFSIRKLICATAKIVVIVLDYLQEDKLFEKNYLNQAICINIKIPTYGITKNNKNTNAIKYRYYTVSNRISQLCQSLTYFCSHFFAEIMMLNYDVNTGKKNFGNLKIPKNWRKRYDKFL
jgi:hypothetical protein